MSLFRPSCSIRYAIAIFAFSLIFFCGSRLVVAQDENPDMTEEAVESETTAPDPVPVEEASPAEPMPVETITPDLAVMLGRMGPFRFETREQASGVPQSVAATEPSQAPTIANLRCEYLANPMAVDAQRPRLSWEMVDSRRGACQTAYCVLAATSPERLNVLDADLWNTGKIVSGRMNQVEYRGTALAPLQRCYWTVQTWDMNGRAVVTPPPACWQAGLSDEMKNSAQWIGLDTRDENEDPELMLPPATHLRKSFATSSPVRNATLHVSSQGICEMSLNGRRVGNDEFTPGWTNYDKRIYYMTYDATDLVVEGENALGAIVAPGWYSGYIGFALLCKYPTPRAIYGEVPSLWAMLRIEYENGTIETVLTDPTWKASTGPIRQTDILMGETYDARLAMPDWNRPGFDDSAWNAAETFESNGGTFEPYPGSPVRCTQTLRPLSVVEQSPGVSIFDMGQNFAGRVGIRVRGAEGQKVTLRFGEMLHEDGRLMTENLRTARVTDHYICAGTGEYGSWEPTFTYHGFQYVEVTGLDYAPTVDDLLGVALNSDTAPVATFACSDPRLNQLYSNICWTQRANFFEVPTDCPQRDERLGWMGDAQVYVRSSTYNMDVAAFFTKWLDAVEDDQLPDGAYPDYAPAPYVHGQPYSPAWMDAGIICPHTIWKVYGDTRVLERHYDSMTRLIDFLYENSDGLLRPADGNSWGDWLAVGSTTPKDLVATAYFAYDAKLMSEIATAIDRPRDAHQYARLFNDVRSAFNNEYVDATTGRIQGDTQTCYVLALSLDLLPNEMLRRQAADRLVELIHENGDLMSTGFLGTKSILHVLSEFGHHDLAYQLLTNTECPSWLFPVENGATSIWERWDSYTKEDGFGRHNAAMNSFSHYSFGAVCEWMFARMAGIDLAAPGYAELLIRPTPGSHGIDNCDATYHSIQGEIRSSWEIADGRFTLNLTIPPGATAELHMPTSDPTSITEGGETVDQAKGVVFLRGDRDAVVYSLISGTYQFESDWVGIPVQ
jgi:alpha-L-rhamnosidase